MRYESTFSDEQIVAALRHAASAGASRDVAGEKLQPPNLCAFFNNLPRPERDRLLALAYPADERPKGSRPAPPAV